MPSCHEFVIMGGMSGELQNHEAPAADVILQPIDHIATVTHALSKVFPTGSIVGWEEFDRFLIPSEPTWGPKELLTRWHAAADSDGVIWFGLNAQNDADVMDAIDASGRSRKYERALQISIQVNNARKVYSIGVPWNPTHITEEATYRILDMLPSEAKTESISIVGIRNRKILGDSRYKQFETKPKEELEVLPDVVSIKTIPPKHGYGYLVTYQNSNYPIELRQAYRNAHPELKRMSIWDWQKMIDAKYSQKE